MKISVITASFRSAHVLGDCLDSVATQSCPSGFEIEHLVADGGSDDGTPELLARWASGKDGRRFWSRPDAGFYDAVNQGLAEVTGDVIGLLNADDFLPDPEVLARVADALADGEADGCYGDLVYVNSPPPVRPMGVVRSWRAGSGDAGAMRYGWMPPHPTVFLRRLAIDRCGPYRTDFGSAADYEWLVRGIARYRLRLRYIPRIQSAMRVGGMSNRSVKGRMQANRNDREAWIVNGLRPPWLLRFSKPLRKLPQWVVRPGENAFRAGG